MWIFGGASRSDEYRDLNVMAEAPVLVDGDFTLSQSGAIQQWVVDQTGQLGAQLRTNMKCCAGFCSTITKCRPKQA